MKWSTMAMSSILISASWAGFDPAMAQHPQHPGHPAAGGHPGGQMHPGGGMAVPAHIQQQMHQQAQHEMRMYQQQMQQIHQQAQHQYHQDVQQFTQWLKSNGGGSASKLPDNPVAFQNWATQQKSLKAHGKSYDPMYDQYRKFSDAMGWTHSQSGEGHSGHSPSTANASGKNGQQARAAGSLGNHSSTKNDATRNGNSAKAQEKRSETRNEERQHAEHGREREREERRLADARARQAQTRRSMAADQVSVNMLRNTYTRLQHAGAGDNGNRGRAMDSLNRAFHDLNSSAPGGGWSGGNLARGQYDRVLREAIGQLRNVETRLGGLTANAPHHARARASVSEAIHHLEGALRYN